MQNILPAGVDSRAGTGRRYARVLVRDGVDYVHRATRVLAERVEISYPGRKAFPPAARKILLAEQGRCPLGKGGQRPELPVSPQQDVQSRPIVRRQKTNNADCSPKPVALSSPMYPVVKVGEQARGRVVVRRTKNSAKAKA